MTTIERFKAAFTFQKLDRLRIYTFGGWPENWRQVNFFGEGKTAGAGVRLGTNAFSPFFPRFEVEQIKDTEIYRIYGTRMRGR